MQYILTVHIVKTEWRKIAIDICHASRYYASMIKSFADKNTKSLYLTGKSRKFPPQIQRRAIRKLEQINAAVTLDDLKVPPSNRLHPLEKDRKDQHSISINDQWRICFYFDGKDAYDVEVCDYH